jgi:hypothetical protein
MNQEFSKSADFDIASVVVPALPDSFGGRVRAKFLKGPDERLTFRAARRPEESESLFV